MQNSQRPRRLVKPFGADAATGYIRQVPVAAQPDGAASYEEGFPPETFQPVGSGGVPPSGQDMNGVLFDLSGNALAYAAGMPAMFNPDFATSIGGYPRYALVASTTAGRIWQSTVENNTANPDSDPTGWLVVVDAVGTVGANWERRASGILEQWGEVFFTSTSQPVVPASFPLPFTDATYGLVVSPVLNAPNVNRDSWVQILRSTRTTTGFSVQYQDSRDDRAGLDGFTWRAIGR